MSQSFEAVLTDVEREELALLPKLGEEPEFPFHAAIAAKLKRRGLVVAFPHAWVSAPRYTLSRRGEKMLARSR